MDRHRGVTSVGVGVACVVLTCLAVTGSAQEVPAAGLPAMITSCGQSPDALMIRVLCTRNKIKVTYDSVLKPEALQGFKTLLITLGASAKGLGEAGIDERQELARVKGVLAKAREQKARVIGLHVGGEARRGPLSAKFIDAAAPEVDYLIVTEDGNQDGYFTKLAAQKKIPLTVVKGMAEVSEVLKKVFRTP